MNYDNMNIGILLTLVWMHFVSDFILQSDWMARNKSKSNKALLAHIAVYSIPFIYFGWIYALVNGIAHFITDWFSSRLSSRMWQQEKVHWFFVVVGFDQAVHISTLLITYQLLFAGG